MSARFSLCLSLLMTILAFAAPLAAAPPVLPADSSFLTRQAFQAAEGGPGEGEEGHTAKCQVLLKNGKDPDAQPRGDEEVVTFDRCIPDYFERENEYVIIRGYCFVCSSATQLPGPPLSGSIE